MQGWISPRLGIRFELIGQDLQLYHPNGEPFTTYAELMLQRDQVRLERDQVRLECDQVRLERNQAQSKLEQLSEKLKTLDPEQLQALGIDLDALS